MIEIREERETDKEARRKIKEQANPVVIESREEKIRSRE
jgi:hypothetical protein